MKDARGHGSNAHNSGVEQIGRKQYVPITSLDLSGAKKWLSRFSEPYHARIISGMRETLRAGKELPPIKLTPDGGIFDGFHRITAYKAEGRSDIPARRGVWEK